MMTDERLAKIRSLLEYNLREGQCHGYVLNLLKDTKECVAEIDRLRSALANLQTEVMAIALYLAPDARMKVGYTLEPREHDPVAIGALREAVAELLRLRTENEQLQAELEEAKHHAEQAAWDALTTREREERIRFAARNPI